MAKRPRERIGGIIVNRAAVEVGAMFGRCTVLGVAFVAKVYGRKNTFAVVKCDCGAIFAACLSELRRGHQKSCGHANPMHDMIHGGYKTRLYGIWIDMRQRCLNSRHKHFADYGGRGIVICPEWLGGFIPFRDWALANGYRDDLEIDRIDNDGNYEPGNCRWATRVEQMRNRRCRRQIQSQYRGLQWRGNRWVVMLRCSNGAVRYFGSFTDEVEAAHAYDRAARRELGDKARPNFSFQQTG